MVQEAGNQRPRIKEMSEIYNESQWPYIYLHVYTNILMPQLEQLTQNPHTLY